MADSPHAKMSTVYSSASTKLGNINIPFPENFQGATATKLQEMNASMNQFLAGTAEHLNNMGTITSGQGTADGDLDKAPKPKEVDAKENKAKVLEMRAKSSPTSANKTAAKDARTEADDTKQQREAALAKHEAASTDTAAKMGALAPPTAPNIPGNPNYDPSKPLGSSDPGSTSDGDTGYNQNQANPINDPSSSSPSTGNGDPSSSTGGGGGDESLSDDPSKAGTQLSGDNAAGQNPSALQQGQGQPQGQGAQPGAGGGAPSTGAGNMLGSPGATLPKDNKRKDPKDMLPAYGAGAAAGGAAGAGLAGAAGGGVGSSVSGVGTNTKISGAGLTAPTPIGTKGPVPGSPGAMARGMGGGGMGGMGGGGAGGGKSHKKEEIKSAFIDPRQVGADVLAKSTTGGIVGRANADYRSPEELAGNYVEFDKDTTPDQNRENNH